MIMDPRFPPLIVRIGPGRRLETLPPQSGFLLTCGRIGTLVASTFTRAIVRLDSGAEREVVPGAELEVVEEVAVLPDGPVSGRQGEPPPHPETVSACVKGAPGIARSAALGGAARRQTALLPRPACPATPDAFAAPGQGARLCPCGVWFVPRRSWQRHHSRRCRQRAHDGRRRAERYAGALSRTRRA